MQKVMKNGSNNLFKNRLIKLKVKKEKTNIVIFRKNMEEKLNGIQLI